MNIFLLINDGVVGLCVFAVIFAVAVDFLFFQKRGDQKKEKKSFVATFTMFCFFFLFYGILKAGVGVFAIQSREIAVAMIFFGILLIVVGAVVNIAGRFKLGNNWSDNIKIYKNHSLVDSGVYSLVRHPLYASLIWMFYGSALIYSNWLAFLTNTFIFVPAMYFRARQEEKMLGQEFSEYKKYQARVGMFLPKIKLSQAKK